MVQHQPQTQHQHDDRRPEHRRHLRRAGTLAVTTITALTVLGLGVAPATARTDRGPGLARVGHDGECFLERVGTQFVRCDDNTGNGVPAPAWIPER